MQLLSYISFFSSSNNFYPKVSHPVLKHLEDSKKTISIHLAVYQRDCADINFLKVAGSK